MVNVRLMVVPKLDLRNDIEKTFFDSEIVARGTDWPWHALVLDEVTAMKDIIPFYKVEIPEFTEPPFNNSGKITLEKYKIIHKTTNTQTGEQLMWGYKISNE